MKYFNLKNRLLILLTAFVMLNSLSSAMAYEESFTLLGATTLSPVTNTNNGIYAVANSEEDYVTLYSDSKSTSRVIREYPKGYAFTVVGSEYGWILVEDDNRERGYINAKDLTLKNGDKTSNAALTCVKAEKIVDYSKQFIGTPYVWGGTNLKTGVDCSGFVYSVYKDFGISLQRSSASMYSQNGNPVSKSDLKSGDLVFFNTSGRGVSHVGMYVGNGQYIHSGNSGVEIANLYSDYASRTYVGAKRILV